MLLSLFNRVEQDGVDQGRVQQEYVLRGRVADCFRPCWVPVFDDRHGDRVTRWHRVDLQNYTFIKMMGNLTNSWIFNCSKILIKNPGANVSYKCGQNHRPVVIEVGKS